MSLLKFLKGKQSARQGQTSKQPSKYDLLGILADAKIKYAKDKNIDDLIIAYEKVFVDANPPLDHPDEIELARLYVQKGNNNKAWGYLNLLLTRGRTQPADIYHEQVQILLSESRHKDAIYTYMLYYLTRYEWLKKYRPIDFKRDIEVCVDNLKWDKSAILTLEKMLSKRIKGELDITSMSSEYRAFCQEMP